MLLSRCQTATVGVLKYALNPTVGYDISTNINSNCQRIDTKSILKDDLILDNNNTNVEVKSTSLFIVFFSEYGW